MYRLDEDIYWSGSKPAFWAPLADAGSGIVDMGLARGSGSATFTRATPAWTKLSNGLWAQIASGSARSCYLGADTAVGAYGGYLSEGAGIQLVTPTASIRDMTDASWVKTTMTTAKTSVGIDGAANSCTRLTASAGNATILQTLVAAASSRTYSVWLKRITGTGNIDITQDGGSTWSTKTINPSTFTQVQLNASVLNAAFGIRIVTNGDAIDADFNQFEVGTVATSPMASAGAVRNADVLTYPGAGNVLGTAGTAYAEVAGIMPLDARMIELDSAGNSPALYYSTTSKLSIFDGTTQSQDTNFTPSALAQKVASKWGASAMKTFLAGAAGTGAVFDNDMNVGTNIAIGRGGATPNYLNGTIKNVRIWQRALTDGQLVSLTA